MVSTFRVGSAWIIEGLVTHDFRDMLPTLSEDPFHLVTEITFDGFVGKPKTHGEATGAVRGHFEEVAHLILEVECGRA